MKFDKDDIKKCKKCKEYAWGNIEKCDCGCTDYELLTSEEFVKFVEHWALDYKF